MPMSYNAWLYGYGNPVRYVDLTGLCSGKPGDPSNSDYACWTQITLIERTYSNIDIAPKNWKTEELVSIKKGLDLISHSIGGVDNFVKLINSELTFKRSNWIGEMFSWNRQAAAVPGLKFIRFYDNAFSESEDTGAIVVIHELAHIIDARIGYLSFGEYKELFWDDCVLDESGVKCISGNGHNPRAMSETASMYGKRDPAEDFAEMFTWYIWMSNGLEESSLLHNGFWPISEDEPRIEYMKKFVQWIRCQMEKEE